MSHIDTNCVQAGWQPKDGEPRVLPIYQSTTFKYEDPQMMADLFDFNAAGHFYSRLSNPTVAAVEEKIAALEGGVGAMLTSSGQAATTAAILTVCQAGDHIVSSSAVYGGTFNLLEITLRKLGIDTTFVPPSATADELKAAIRPNTKLVFGETLSNPALDVLDIETFAAVAHENHLPLFVDNTFPTPINCRPFEFGADVVLHSTSKYMDGHAMSLGGVIVDSGNFDWAASGRHACMTEPDESYHGISYTETYGKKAYIVKARMQLMRDFGVYPAAHSAFLLNLGLETLAVRMKQYCENAMTVVRYLEKSPYVERVIYPGLESDESYPLAQKYLKGCSGVISFVIKGGKETAMRFMNTLELASNEVHVADIRTCVLHPASETHRQLTDEQLIAAGIESGMIRLSVGLENTEDIITDLDKAFSAIEY